MAFTNGTWEAEGTIINPDTFGLAAGSIVADGTVVETSNGQIRIYVFADDAVKSLISDDGINFTVEAGNRYESGAGMPRIKKLSDDSYRLYYQQSDGIYSATSTDGLNFTAEDGVRITTAAGTAAGTGLLSAPTLVEVNGVTYAYYSDVPLAGTGPNDHAVVVATTSDGLTFNIDTTERISENTAIGQSAEHPDAVLNSDGSVTVFFADNVAPQFGNGVGIYVTTSTDGTTFSTATSTGISGNDPFILQHSDGTTRMYFGDFDSSVGGFIQAARYVENVATSSTSGGDDITGTSHSNTVIALSGDDTITGAGGADMLYGNKGSDLIFGNQANDSLYGGQGDDTMYGGAASDLIYGNIGADTLYGNNANDTIYGGQGTDLISGGDGNDFLSGDLGNDGYYTGDGNDTVRIASNGGTDTIHDFTVASDVLTIASNANGNGISSYSELQSNISAYQTVHTQIDLGGGNIVIIGNVTTDQLSSSNFTFF